MGVLAAQGGKLITRLGALCDSCCNGAPPQPDSCEIGAECDECPDEYTVRLYDLRILSWFNASIFMDVDVTVVVEKPSSNSCVWSMSGDVSAGDLGGDPWRVFISMRRDCILTCEKGIRFTQWTIHAFLYRQANPAQAISVYSGTPIPVVGNESGYPPPGVSSPCPVPSEWLSTPACIPDDYEFPANQCGFSFGNCLISFVARIDPGGTCHLNTPPTCNSGKFELIP